ncbi:MAG: hypothetical protein FJ194_10770 [Gammaproteobacteria bacterium]|nr:hypothetical protein [Gammaproteobacteria bacterium]
MISVSHIEEDLYQVTVQGQQPTVHEVRMTQADYRLLSDRRCTHEWAIVQAFVFLLEHEPNTSILPVFDIMEIGRYFPEFREEMKRRLG